MDSSQHFSDKPDTCRQCNKNTIAVYDYERGEIFCQSCGTVKEEKISDQGRDYVSQSLDESYQRSRTGGPNSLAFLNYGVSTEISDRSYRANGFGSASETTRRSYSSVGPTSTAGAKQTKQASQHYPSIYDNVWRMKKLDLMTKTKSSKARSLNRAFQFLGRLRDYLSLPDHTVERAAYIYRKSIDIGLSRGRSTECLVCGCVSVACKEFEIPYTSAEISDKLMANKKIVFRVIRDIHDKAGISLSPMGPTKYISKIVNKLELDEKTMRKSIHILKIAHDNDIVGGKDPSCFAAACVFIGCRNSNKHITVENVSKQSLVSQVSIRDRIKEILQTLGQT